MFEPVAFCDGEPGKETLVTGDAARERLRLSYRD